MPHSDAFIAALADNLSTVMHLAIRQATAPLLARIAVLEARELTPGPAGKDGRDIDPALLLGLQAAVTTVQHELQQVIVEQHRQTADLRRAVDDLMAQEPLAGPPGDPGPAGERGLTGERGPVGERGEPGARGDVGPMGERGLPGERGEPGPRGEIGAVGPAGAAGRDGVDGATGPIGPAGPQGTAGLAGLEGPAGPAGPMGPPGPAGPMGVDGKQGAPGQNGLNGRDGLAGANGADGRPGRDGTLENLKIVRVDDRTIHLCRKDTGDVLDGGVLVFPVMLYKDVWDAATAYQTGDVVTRQGSMWIATIDTLGSVPGNGASAWQLIVKTGREGKAGPMGPPGKDGAPGRDLTHLMPDGQKYR